VGAVSVRTGNTPRDIGVRVEVTFDKVDADGCVLVSEGMLVRVAALLDRIVERAEPGALAEELDPFRDIVGEARRMRAEIADAVEP